MITQGWPLWAVRRATGQIYAITAWEDSFAGRLTPVGVELGADAGEPVALLLAGPLTFVGDQETARRMTR